MSKPNGAFKRYLFNLLEIVRKTFSGRGLRKIGLIGKIYNFLFSYFKPEYFKIDGKKIYTDDLDILQLYRFKEYTHEDFVKTIIKKEVGVGDVFLDLGAHVGYYTAIASELVKPGGKVFAFEPDPHNFSRLTKTVQANSLLNVVLEQKAVADKTGSATFFLYGSTTNSMAPELYNLGGKTKSIKVATVSLDDYFAGRREKVNFIKMDIEGAEGLALLGMGGILKNNDLKVITEFTPVALRKLSRMEPMFYLQKFLDAGFYIYEIYPSTKSLNPLFYLAGGKVKLEFNAVKEIIERCTPKVECSCFGTNIFCVKREL